MSKAPQARRKPSRRKRGVEPTVPLTAAGAKLAIISALPEALLRAAAEDCVAGALRVLDSIRRGDAFIYPVSYTGVLVEYGVALAILAEIERVQVDVAAEVRKLHVPRQAYLFFGTERYVRSARSARINALGLIKAMDSTNKSAQSVAYLKASIVRAWTETVNTLYSDERYSAVVMARTVFG